MFSIKSYCVFFLRKTAIQIAVFRSSMSSIESKFVSREFKFICCALQVKYNDGCIVFEKKNKYLKNALNLFKEQ